MTRSLPNRIDALAGLPDNIGGRLDLMRAFVAARARQTMATVLETHGDVRVADPFAPLDEREIEAGDRVATAQRVSTGSGDAALRLEFDSGATVLLGPAASLELESPVAAAARNARWVSGSLTLQVHGRNPFHLLVPAGMVLAVEPGSTLTVRDLSGGAAGVALQSGRARLTALKAAPGTEATIRLAIGRSVVLSSQGIRLSLRGSGLPSILAWAACLIFCLAIVAANVVTPNGVGNRPAEVAMISAPEKPADPVAETTVFSVIEPDGTSASTDEVQLGELVTVELPRVPHDAERGDARSPHATGVLSYFQRLRPAAPDSAPVYPARRVSRDGSKRPSYPDESFGMMHLGSSPAPRRDIFASDETRSPGHRTPEAAGMKSMASPRASAPTEDFLGGDMIHFAN